MLCLVIEIVIFLSVGVISVFFRYIVIISNVGVIDESFPKNYLEGGLISESFFLLWLHLQKNVQNHYHAILLSWAYSNDFEDKVDSDLAHFLGDGTEIKPTLFHSFLQIKIIVNCDASFTLFVNMIKIRLFPVSQM